MKKLMVVLFIFIVLLGTINTQKEFSLLNYFSGEYTVYTSNKNGTDSVNLGFCYMNSQKVDDCIVGESMEIKNLEVSSVIKTLNAKIIKTEYLEDRTTVIYAYSNLIEEKVNVSGSFVNLQIAIKGDKSIIGWPLILGSF